VVDSILDTVIILEIMVKSYIRLFSLDDLLLRIARLVHVYHELYRQMAAGRFTLVR